ncbi:MAG: hypothetical protein JNM39_01480 [Bdellovibrionaceae bacterium]|jgi:hypothetical protein|nr:hypothetical protein [Pseudobdellovibrionaceae bacterium]
MFQNRLRPSLRSNNHGQMVVESVLILTLCIGFLMAASNVFKRGDVINKLINGPWARTAVMIETGTWSGSLAEGRAKHPNTGARSRILNTE